MTVPSTLRRVIVLAPMPLEMDAITTAFGLSSSGAGAGATWTGRVGGSEVTAIHIGMGPPLTRKALGKVFEAAAPDHVMIAGICGGLSQDLPVGTLINPEIVIDHTSGATYAHTPPGDVPLLGKLVTTEEATLDVGLSERFRDDGCVGVDMETSAVAEVCEQRGCPWSAYRCIGDRYFDGFLDERLLAITNQDGSGNMAELQRLLASDPGLSAKLDHLAHDSTLAARLAAEAAVRGCLALDG